jgi:hypothetical protein
VLKCPQESPRSRFAPSPTVSLSHDPRSHSEPRHLFDGDGAAPVTIDQHDDSASHPATDTRDDSQRQAATADQPSSPAGQTDRTELVIVDPAVRGWQELVAGLPAGSEVLVLDPRAAQASNRSPMP